MCNVLVLATVAAGCCLVAVTDVSSQEKKNVALDAAAPPLLKDHMVPVKAEKKEAKETGVDRFPIDRAHGDTKAFKATVAKTYSLFAKGFEPLTVVNARVPVTVATQLRWLRVGHPLAVAPSKAGASKVSIPLDGLHHHGISSRSEVNELCRLLADEEGADGKSTARKDVEKAAADLVAEATRDATKYHGLKLECEVPKPSYVAAWVLVKVVTVKYDQHDKDKSALLPSDTSRKDAADFKKALAAKKVNWPGGEYSLYVKHYIDVAEVDENRNPIKPK